MTKKILIKYFDPDMPRIQKIEIGDWIDLRAAEDIILRAGEFCKVPLGVAMQLPEGFEALVVPRGSTFKNFFTLQTNSPGVVDESYCGNNDQWFVPILAVENTVIHRYDRICQFRIQEKQPDIEFVEVDELTNRDRGGFGSTGVQ